MKHILVIDDDRELCELLREFQTRKTHMAIVTDEFGGVRGSHP